MDLLTGLLGGGALAVVIFGTNWLINSNHKGDKKLALHKMFQKHKEEKIQSIATKQAKVEVNIKKSEEEIPIESQEMIRKIVDNTAKEINEVIEEKDPSVLQDKYNSMMNL